MGGLVDERSIACIVGGVGDITAMVGKKREKEIKQHKNTRKREIH